MSTARTQHTRMSTLAAIAASLACLSLAHATDRLVPSQYPTIQAAINAAVHGDIVTVSPGLYREALQLNKIITLQGHPSAEASAVILTGVGVAGGAMLVGGQGTPLSGQITIRNLTVDGQSIMEAGQWAGLFIDDDDGGNFSVLIEGCIFKDLWSAWTDGGAMFLTSTPTVIRRCSFLRNRSTGHGAAIYGNDSASAIIEACVFQDHNVFAGTFYARIDANVIVRDCVLRNSILLCGNHQTGTVTFSNNIGCLISALSNGGYVDGGNNNWAGPCPDCDSNGKLDLEEILFGGADCNGNDLLDACEVVDNPKLDGNGDGLIDECQCLADVTGNGSVDAIDLAALMSSWGSNGSGEFDADVTNDGVVNGLDLAVILDGWGACPN